MLPGCKPVATQYLRIAKKVTLMNIQRFIGSMKETYVVIMAKTAAHTNDEGLMDEAPMLAEAKEVKFVGRQMTLGYKEVNLSQSFTMMLYASDIWSTSVFIL
jgi:hypothetical protein